VSTALQETQEAMQKVGQVVYSQEAETSDTTTSNEDGTSSDNPSETDDAVEGEYREV